MITRGMMQNTERDTPGRYLVFASFCFVIISSVLVLPALKDGAITGKSHGFLWASGALVLVCSVYFLVRRSPVVFTLSVTDALVATYLLYTFVRLLYTPEASWFNLRFLELVFATGIFYLNKMLLRDFRTYFVILIILLGTAFFQALVGLLQLYGFLDGYHGYFNVTGTFFNPAAYAGYLISVFPLALGMYYASDQRTWVRCFAVATGLSAILILPATLSRAAWGALLVSVIVFFAHRSHVLRRRADDAQRKSVSVMVYGVVTVLVFLLLMTSLHWKRDSSLGRIFIWKITGQVIQDHPVFGVGFDQYTTHFGRYQSAYFRDNPDAAEDEIMTAGKGEYAFNEFLFVAAEKGFFGLVLFIGILISAVVEYFKRRNRHDPRAMVETAVLSGLAGLVVFSFFSYPFSVTPVFLNLYIFISILSGAGQDRPGSLFHWTPGAVVKRLFMLSICISVVVVMLKLSVHYQAMRDWKTASFLKEYRDYSRAIKFMRNIEPVLHSNGQFMFEYGQTLALRGRYTEGIAVLEHAAKLTSDPYLFNSLGQCHQHMGEFAKAEQAYENSIYLIPHKFYPRYLLAKLYLEMGMQERALSVAHQIMSMKVKVPSEAVDEIKEEMAQLIEVKGGQGASEQ